MTTLTQRFANAFHVGRLPEEARSQMASDGGILYLAEGVLETALFRHFRSPQGCSLYRRTAFIGFVVMSQRRIIVRAEWFHQIHINLAYGEPRFKVITFKARPRYLSLAFDASDQMPDSSGQVEIRMYLPDVSKAADVLTRQGACFVAD
jgi:hypothetical protein